MRIFFKMGIAAPSRFYRPLSARRHALSPRISPACRSKKRSAPQGSPSISLISISKASISRGCASRARICSPRGSQAQNSRAPISREPILPEQTCGTPISTKANLEGATLYAALLDGADFTSANLARARIIGGGRGVRFTNAKMAKADLGADPANQGMVPVRVDLTDANFDRADLSGANLAHAVLASASFKDADLRGAHFEYAKMSGADLSGVKADGAVFTHAELDGARLPAGAAQ